MTIDKTNGCFVVSSNKLGLIKITYSELDYKAEIKRVNKDLNRKPKLKIEAIFSCKNYEKEFSKIQRCRKLKMHRAITIGDFHYLPAHDAIAIVSDVLKRKPEWVYNENFKNQLLPGIKS